MDSPSSKSTLDHHQHRPIRSNKAKAIIHRLYILSIMSYIDESEVSNLSDAQEMALSLLPIPSSILSIIGSSIIIHLVYKASQRGPYMRILFGMSICDLITSLAWAIQGFVMPAATSQRVWAFGNDASCTAIGFLTQFAFSGFLYYGMLSYYYVLTIRWGVRDAKFSKYVEPWMHVISVGYPLITASVGAAMGFFHENELGIGCWINDYPRNCGFDPTETGMKCKSPLIGWIMGGSVILFILASIIVTNTIIYLHVRFTITRARRFAFFQQANNNNHHHHHASAARTTTTSANHQTNNRQRQQEANDSQTRRVRAVAAQCFLYVAAFVLCYTWTIAIRILEGTTFEAKDEASIYFLLVGQAVFGPLTGWLNLIIYLRPRYLRCRKDIAQESKWWAVKRALFGDKIPRTRTATCSPTATMAAPALSNNNRHSYATESQHLQPSRISRLLLIGGGRRSEFSSTTERGPEQSKNSTLLPIPSCHGAGQAPKRETVASCSSPTTTTTTLSSLQEP